jgi:hypothetical protein
MQLAILVTAMDEHCHCFLCPDAGVGKIFCEESFPCPDRWPFHEFAPQWHSKLHPRGIDLNILDLDESSDSFNV